MSVARRSPGVAVEQVYGRTAADSAHEVWHGSARVVVKTEDRYNPGMTVNEFIATRIAMAIGIPVPMGDAAEWEGKNAFVSAQVDIEGQTLPPANVDDIIDSMSAEAAKIVVFDVLIHNGDRHEDNLLYHPKVGLWAIDHEEALLGADVRDSAMLARRADDKTHIECDAFLRLTTSDLLPAIQLVRSLPVGAIRAATGEAQARRLLTGKQASAVAKFLKHRRDKIYDLVHDSMKAKGGATGWPLNTKSTLKPNSPKSTQQGSLLPPGT